MKLNASKEVLEQIWDQLSKKLEGSQDLATLAEEYGKRVI